MKLTVILSIFFLWITSSCSKTENKTALLTSGKWQIRSHTDICLPGGSGSATSTDFYAMYPDCSKDDYYVFYKNRSVELTDAAVICNPANPQTYSSSWSFGRDETSIQFKGKNWEISQLDKSTFIISYKGLLFPGGTKCIETISFTKL